MAGKSLFPLNPHYEDSVFEDTDAHFRRLPYADEIPDMTNDGLRIPPMPITYWPSRTCREKVAYVGVWGFLLGAFFSGRWLGKILYGYSIGRYRLFACEFAAGALVSTAGMVIGAFMDPKCSPYLAGRRRPQYPEEALRHMMNARYRMFENIDLIMHSRKAITNYEFYSITENYTKTREAMDTSGYTFRHNL